MHGEIPAFNDSGGKLAAILVLSGAEMAAIINSFAAIRQNDLRLENVSINILETILKYLTNNSALL